MSTGVVVALSVFGVMAAGAVIIAIIAAVAAVAGFHSPHDDEHN